MLTQVGIGGVFAMLVIREVLGFLKAREESKDDAGGDGSARDQMDRIEDGCKALMGSTQTMATLISATDPAGLPLIYRDSQSGIVLNANIEALQRSIERLGDRIDRPAP